MNAKHKRPFYVFAAVALVCGSILFAEVRGTANDGGPPDGEDGQVEASSVGASGPKTSGSELQKSVDAAEDAADDPQFPYYWAGAADGQSTTDPSAPLDPRDRTATGDDPGKDPRGDFFDLQLDPESLPDLDEETDAPEDDPIVTPEDEGADEPTTKTRGGKKKKNQTDDEPKSPQDWGDDILDGDPTSEPPPEDDGTGDGEAGGFGNEGTEPEGTDPTSPTDPGPVDPAPTP